jgi:hypothetical protein
MSMINCRLRQTHATSRALHLCCCQEQPPRRALSAGKAACSSFMAATGTIPRRVLGNTGLEVSVLGFGASPLGGTFHVRCCPAASPPNSCCCCCRRRRCCCCCCCYYCCYCYHRCCCCCCYLCCRSCHRPCLRTATHFIEGCGAP